VRRQSGYTTLVFMVLLLVAVAYQNCGSPRVMAGLQGSSSSPSLIPPQFPYIRVVEASGFTTPAGYYSNDIRLSVNELMIRGQFIQGATTCNLIIPVDPSYAQDLVYVSNKLKFCDPTPSGTGFSVSDMPTENVSAYSDPDFKSLIKTGVLIASNSGQTVVCDGQRELYIILMDLIQQSAVDKSACAAGFLDPLSSHIQ